MVKHLELLAERPVGTGPRLLDLSHLAVELIERLAHRLHEGLDRLPPLIEIADRLLLELAEGLPRLGEEIDAVDAEGVGRERLELRSYALVGRAFRVELRAELRVECRQPCGLRAQLSQLLPEAPIILVPLTQPLAHHALAAAQDEPRD